MSNLNQQKMNLVKHLHSGHALFFQFDYPSTMCRLQTAPLEFHRINLGFIPMSILRGAVPRQSVHAVVFLHLILAPFIRIDGINLPCTPSQVRQARPALLHQSTSSSLSFNAPQQSAFREMLLEKWIHNENRHGSDYDNSHFDRLCRRNDILCRPTGSIGG